MGQTADNKLTSEEQLSFSDLLLPGFPVVEFRPLWKIIWQTSTTYINTPKARIVGVYDIRQLASVRTGATAVSDHGLLTGLSDDDHLQYVHISENRTITASHTIEGTLNITNNTNSALTVTGNVGIGTTTSSYKLQVQGDINYTGILRLNGTQLNTTNIPEGTNLYYTSARATDDAIVMAIALG
jgi:hypothetical protein